MISTESAIRQAVLQDRNLDVTVQHNFYVDVDMKTFRSNYVFSVLIY